MNFPYRSRILLALPGHEPIELVRFPRPISTYDRRHWLRDIAPEWTVTEENIRLRTVAPKVKVTSMASVAPEERGDHIHGS